ncbi:hypothetical protein B0T16DRAFT_197568 [Cercophora newfieldiana]|uniref:Uncharacterized protein n=1 Tax=Cercophora newfieldiana TaxID=92897 RepID=A0AA39Y323_9PEZI|nr:hypothetical protein B0T16DRAFT_197568 [Cercophora newfieldiana]
MGGKAAARRKPGAMVPALGSPLQKGQDRPRNPRQREAGQADVAVVSRAGFGDVHTGCKRATLIGMRTATYICGGEDQFVLPMAEQFCRLFSSDLAISVSAPSHQLMLTYCVSAPRSNISLPDIEDRNGIFCLELNTSPNDSIQGDGPTLYPGDITSSKTNFPARIISMYFARVYQARGTPDLRPSILCPFSMEAIPQTPCRPKKDIIHGSITVARYLTPWRSVVEPPEINAPPVYWMHSLYQ